MWLTGYLKMGEDLARYLLMLWVPAVSSPGTAWDGAEQSPEPRAGPSLAAGELGWFRLMMGGVLYTGAGAG